jgi:hypothetical protein
MWGGGKEERGGRGRGHISRGHPQDGGLERKRQRPKHCASAAAVRVPAPPPFSPPLTCARLLQRLLPLLAGHGRLLRVAWEKGRREREVERVRDEGEPSAPSAFFSLRAPASSCTLLCLASGARDSAPSSFAGGCARGCARGTHRHPWLCVPCAVEKGAKKGKCMYARSASPPAHTFLPSLFTYDKKIEEVARDATTRHHDPSITPDTGRMPVLPQAAVTEAAVAHH